jgi:hypothetical protein
LFTFTGKVDRYSATPLASGLVIAKTPARHKTTARQRGIRTVSLIILLFSLFPNKKYYLRKAPTLLMKMRGIFITIPSLR